MAEVITVIENNQNKFELTEALNQLVKKAISATLDYENFDGIAEVNVTFCDNEEIKQLNSQFRNIQSQTDVLSFPLGENGVYDINYSNGAKQLGDIVISVEKAVSQAEEYGHSLTREIAFLTVHSVLHLLGYDHVTSEQDEKEMFKKQDDVMNILNIKRG